MPAPMPSLREIGMALMSHSRIRKMLIRKKPTPERKTAPRAVCQGTCMPLTTVNAK